MSIIIIPLIFIYTFLTQEKKETKYFNVLVSSICKAPNNFEYRDEDIITFHCKKKIIVVKVYNENVILLRTKGIILP